MNDIQNLRDTIAPKSDQLNAEQLLAGPMTITVSEVRRGDADQPVVVHYHGEDGRPYKPCKSMRKVLIFAWGEDGSQWVGRAMTLYNNPAVKWGGVAVGGVRISHLSHIERDLVLQLTATKGKKEPQTIKRLVQADPHAAALDLLKAASKEGLAALEAQWKATAKPAQKALAPKLPELKEAARQADEAAAAAKAAQAQAAPEPATSPAPAADDGEVF